MMALPMRRRSAFDDDGFGADHDVGFDDDVDSLIVPEVASRFGASANSSARVAVGDEHVSVGTMKSPALGSGRRSPSKRAVEPRAPRHSVPTCPP